MIYLKNKMVVKVTKQVKYAMALYHKIKARPNTFYMESLMLFSKSAHLLDYAALLFVLVSTDNGDDRDSLPTPYWLAGIVTCLARR